MIYKIYYTHIKLCTQLKIVKILISVQLKINIKKKRYENYVPNFISYL